MPSRPRTIAPTRTRDIIMDFNNLATAAVSRLVGRMLRRALVVVVMGVCALIAIYHFTIAGNIALIGQFGDLEARLIIGAIYAAIALIFLLIFWATGSQPQKFHDTPALNARREKQVAMLVQAAMAGYSVARKGQKTR